MLCESKQKWGTQSLRGEKLTGTSGERGMGWKPVLARKKPRENARHFTPFNKQPPNLMTKSYDDFCSRAWLDPEHPGCLSLASCVASLQHGSGFKKGNIPRGKSSIYKTYQEHND